MAEAGSHRATLQHVRLISLSTLPGAWPDVPDLAVDLVCWLQNVVAQPDERLGRPGPMCPALPAVLREDVLVVGRVDRVAFTQPETLDSVLSSVAVRIIDDENELRCAVLTFPGIQAWETRGCVEFAVERMRAAIVTQGAMIGSFHPYQTRPSRHNRVFQSMRAPVPLIGIRRLFPFDRPSLVEDTAALLAFDKRWPDSREHDKDPL